MKLLEKWEKQTSFWFLLIVSTIFFFLRFPSLFEPDWYGDEGVYQTLGIGIRMGRLLYRDIFDNKPPLLYVLYSLVSSSEFAIRFLSLIFGILSVIVFYFLAKKLFANEKISFITTSIFAVLFGLPLIEGNIANAENFMLLPNIIAGLLVFKSIEIKDVKRRYKLQIFAGLILGLSFLIKIVALFDFGAFLVFLFFMNYSKNLLEIFNLKNIVEEAKNVIFFALGFSIPIIITALYFILNHAFSNFIQATFFSNIGYVGYGNNFIIPQGFLIFKLILLALFSLFIFYSKKGFGAAFSFIALWLSFSLFDAYFSQRPYTHYVLVLLPSFILMIGMFLIKKNFSRLAGLSVLISLILVLLGFTFYVKTVFYYQNFISYIFGRESVTSYQKFFDNTTPRDYEIAGFINLYTDKTGGLFIWGNNAQVYALTGKLPPGKYTVAYHIANYKDGFSNTNTALKKNPPKFIVLMPNVSTYPFSLSDYKQRINMEGAEIYERIY
jgi:Dolichyl-phosphate-mannose-protein mannosyltransferase